jgi:hypothetical protein
MSKDKISDYSETPGNNTDIGGINIAEGMLPSDVNNAIREQMAQLKKFQSGASSESVTFVTANVTTANAGQVNVDNLRLDGNTFSSTNTNGNIELTPNGAGRVTTSALSATSPRVITAINDTNGNELFGVTATGSAVNEFTVANAATGNAPTLSATGGDTNIGMALTPKGTGGVIFPAGAVGTPAITTSGDLNTGIYFPAADTIAFTEGGAEAMRIDSSGNVLVGTTSAGNFRFKALGAGGNLSGNAYFVGLIGDGSASNKGVGLGYDNTSQTGIVYGETASAASNLAFWTYSGSAWGERMRIDSSGNVGIGTSSPTAVGSYRVLDINGTAGGYVGLYTNATKTGAVFAGSDGLALESVGASNAMAFYTNNAERARITSGGYFKASNAGTYLSATDSYHEMVNSEANGPSLIAFSNSASLTSDGILQLRAARNTTNNTFYVLSYFNQGASAFKFRVADSGDVTNTNNSYGQISDIKTKQDIVDAASQWDDIKNIRVRKFRFKNNPTGPLQIGVVAQEAEVVSPGLIDEHPDKTQETRTREVEKTREVEVTPAVLDEDGNVVEPAVMETETYIEEEEYTETVDLGTTTKSIKYSVLYMKAVKALQEAMERIETLEAKVAALEGN